MRNLILLSHSSGFEVLMSLPPLRAFRGDEVPLFGLHVLLTFFGSVDRAGPGDDKLVLVSTGFVRF